MGADHWKWIAGFMASVILALGGAAIGAASNKGVSQSRVKELIQTEGPYVQDGPAIKLALVQIQLKLDTIGAITNSNAAKLADEHDLLIKLQTIIGQQQGRPSGGTP